MIVASGVQDGGGAILGVAQQIDELGDTSSMAMPERYLFVCINERAEGHPRGSCMQRGAADVFNELRESQGRHDLTTIKVVYGGCMEACTAGPVVAVMPDNVWYGGVTVDDCDTIIREHCVNDRTVEMLRLTPDDFIAPD